MTRDACPRCGAERPVLGPCPECGFEDPHPGVLGAYRQAARRIREEPSLVLPFVLPTLLLLGLRGLLYVGGEVGTAPAGEPDVVEGLIGVLVLYLGMSWYFAALGSLVPARQQGRPRVPEGPVYVGSAVAAAAVAAPIAGVVLLVGIPGPENLNAFGLVGAVLLLLGSMVAAGRSVGLPVETALSGDWSWTAVKRANRRGRENGGLGLVFLAFLMLVPLVVVPALANLLAPPALAGPLQLVVTVLGLTLVGAWTGTAIAIGQAGELAGATRTFECPRCGATARVEGGRARCQSCQLEGPFYAGERA
jgi:predicted RNA-binding Zn-ribbon protein involved in translation (DUF1610 family)